MIFIISCGNDKNNSNEKEIISNIESEGYKYIGECATPSGIWDTLILGYTNRTNGIFHMKELRPKDLKIKGYEFEEVSNEKWKSKLMIYKFEFNNKIEVNKFEEFQDFMLNYQRHSKNKVKLFQEDSKWFLRFEPMP